MGISFGPGGSELEVAVAAGHHLLAGTLNVPAGATGIVLFAHGSGSSRQSSRNRYVAQVLQNAGLATLLFDLLTPAEEQLDRNTAELRFNIRLLASRLTGATDWVCRQPELRGFSLGYFGASTGGAAALVAAAERSNVVDAVVSRGGRPDLAGAALPLVVAPTLLLVGGEDREVITLNQQARQLMRHRVELTIVPGATHLFEEPGALDEVAKRAAEWFGRYFSRSHVRS